MSKVIDLHIADTALEGINPPTSLNPNLPVINWPVDWSKAKNVAGEAILTYKPAPFDAPQTARFSVQKIADVYSGSPVDRNYQLPYKRGLSVLCQLSLVATITDTDSPTYRVDLPISARLVVEAPLSGLLTVGHIRTVAERTMATMYETGVVDDTRLTELLKESMLPVGV